MQALQQRFIKVLLLIFSPKGTPKEEVPRLSSRLFSLWNEWDYSLRGTFYVCSNNVELFFLCLRE